jgi:fused signal recognition particle receptor
VDTALEAVELLRKRVKEEKIKDMDGARACMRAILAEMLCVGDTGLNLSTRPSVVLFIGVNGVGKTTTIGKLGAALKGQGKKVLLAAGDTFRAAAA